MREYKWVYVDAWKMNKSIQGKGDTFGHGEGIRRHRIGSSQHAFNALHTYSGRISTRLMYLHDQLEH